MKSPDAVQRLRSRVTGIYSEVLGSEECIERMVCELGSATKSIYYKDSVYRYVTLTKDVNHHHPSSSPLPFSSAWHFNVSSQVEKKNLFSMSDKTKGGALVSLLV